jgi:hypothetical protein
MGDVSFRQIAIILLASFSGRVTARFVFGKLLGLFRAMEQDLRPLHFGVLQHGKVFAPFIRAL